jgi:hypothetical protein
LTTLGVQIGGQIASKERRLSDPMREILTTTKGESLSDTEKKCFLNCHIPYRLKLLRQGLTSYPANGSLERAAAVEAALVYGRQLIEFLGLGIRPNEHPPVLCEKTGYYQYKRGGTSNTDEVKITDLGGQFQKKSALSKEDQSTLARFCFGASKATAHLTEGSGHNLNENNGAIFIRGCKLIDELVKGKLGDMLEREKCDFKACHPDSFVA